MRNYFPKSGENYPQGAILPETGGPLVPPYGVFFADFLDALGKATLREFLSACPDPALLEAPSCIQPASGFYPRRPKEPRKKIFEARLRDLLTSPELSDVKIHFLVPRQAGEDVTVGRSLKSCDVRLSDQSTSRSHARFSPGDPWWRLTDLESSQGVTIEGGRLAVGVPTPIVNGQLLGFGDYRLVFLAGEDIHALGQRWKTRMSSPLHAGIPPCGIPLCDLVPILSSVTREQVLDWGLPPFLLRVPTEPLLIDPGVRGSDQTLACSTKELRELKRTKAVGATLIHTLTPRGPTHSVSIGRAQGLCDVVLPEPSVSKRHAELRCTKGIWRVMDLESHNGTFLDGKRLPPGIMTPVRPGAALWFSCYRAMFLLPRQVHDLATSLGKKRKQKKPAA